MNKIIIALILIALGGVAALGFKLLNQGKGNIMEKQGVKIEVLKDGTGVTARSGNTVSVNYVGTLTDGTKFDSSVDRGQPFSFTVGIGQVIRGWDIGVEGMKVGEKVRLTIPPELAYGSQSVGPIPPNSTLIFEIDLLGVQ